MISEKQKWFIMKLIKEIESLGRIIESNELYYLSNLCDSYKTSKKEASEDIDYLLRLKKEMEEAKW